MKTQIWCAVATYVLIAIVAQATQLVAVVAYDASDLERQTFRESIVAPVIEGCHSRGINRKFP